MNILNKAMLLAAVVSFGTSAAISDINGGANSTDEDYGRTLPFYGDEVRDLGIKLPKPIGISVFTHSQEDKMGLDNFTLQGDPNIAEDMPDGVSGTVNTTNLLALRADMWVLPFLNLHAMIGKATTSSNITLGMNDFDGTVTRDHINGLGTTSDIIGVGAVLAAGYGNWFGAVDTTYVATSVNGVGANLNALVITPMVGYMLPNDFRIMVGAQYQSYDRYIRGNIDGHEFSVRQHNDSWSTMVGVSKEFDDNWEASLMYQKGRTRNGATLILGKRF
ncbi:outer membrane beta-barrel protein [Vibrio maritimus]|uniref:outer membrane beta-barrel protein n=1 Tax=Vibrio maritimus TaxID=990268 RepID=UPI001F39F84E|nr:outer membrane beta-barrel protein [Vibrio maritimus]